jgi:hypothetical protein
VVSIPITPVGAAPGASGAYGPEPGDVSITAGNQVLGSYTLRNGTGAIAAGVAIEGGQVSAVLNPLASVGAGNAPASLSLVSGNWSIWSGGNIYLNEIRNPNGAFNSNPLAVQAGAFIGNTDGTITNSPPASQVFLYDYDPLAEAAFWAGNTIQLFGQLTGRSPDHTTPIYPPRLSLSSGAGGIELLGSLILYPSPHGILSLATRDGGNLAAQPGVSPPPTIVMSDSGLPSYRTFATEHAVMPLHLLDTNSVSVDISGNVQNAGLQLSLPVSVSVEGNAYNFDLSALNPRPDSTTQVTAGGRIQNTGLLVMGQGRFVVRAQGIDLGVSGGITFKPALNPALAGSASESALEVASETDLSMEFSRISNDSLLGSVAVAAAGAINIGGPFTPHVNVPVGIYSTEGGRVAVTALGDIIMNGSRVAALRGGDVSIQSLTGNIDGGTNKPNLLIVPNGQTAAGFTILATDLPQSALPAGSITVQADLGSIFAGAGGIAQVELNGLPTGEITLEAGDSIDGGAGGVIGSTLTLRARNSIYLGPGQIVGSTSVTLIAPDESMANLAIGTNGIRTVNGQVEIGDFPVSNALLQRITSGSNLLLDATSVASEGPLQWKRNGQPIPGAVNSTLSITNNTLADRGIYTVEIQTPQGSHRSALIAVVLVAVPLTFQAPVLSDNGAVTFSFRSADGPFTPADVARFSLLGSPDLMHWSPALNIVSLGTDGGLTFSDTAAQREFFYRVEEN